jgi:hypothetical protein
LLVLAMNEAASKSVAGAEEMRQEEWRNASSLSSLTAEEGAAEDLPSQPGWGIAMTVVLAAHAARTTEKRMVAGG